MLENNPKSKKKRMQIEGSKNMPESHGIPMAIDIKAPISF
jgi:hypothetical protein